MNNPQTGSPYSELALAVRDVLLSEGEVSLPGIGILRTESYPARLDRVGARIFPPGKKPVFFPDAGTRKVTPGLETRFRQLVPEEQRDALTRLCRQMVAEGKAGRTVLLEAVGEWRWHGGPAPEFTPAEFNYDLDMYGLSPVSASPVLRRSAAEAAQEARQEREGRRLAPALPPVYRARDRYFLPLATGALLLALGLSLWLVFRQEPATMDVASIPATDPEDETSLPPAAIDENRLRMQPDVIIDPDLTDPEPEEEIAADMEEESAVAPEAPKGGVSPSGTYIVVGHFGDPANARRVLEKLEELGWQGESLPRGKLTRVIVHVDENRLSAEEVLGEVRRIFDPGAWIVRER
ncbi:MAG: SPOR domain-containing protein [Saprospiraceae bacterium]|nr:SPOR domain-containing protein [Saprospiraceae bacterium]